MFKEDSSLFTQWHNQLRLMFFCKTAPPTPGFSLILNQKLQIQTIIFTGMLYVCCFNEQCYITALWPVLGMARNLKYWKTGAWNLVSSIYIFMFCIIFTLSFVGKASNGHGATFYLVCLSRLQSYLRQVLFFYN